MKKIQIYTDGCCLRNPGGKGGWAFVVVVEKKVIHTERGKSNSTTNNIMELMAIFKAYEWIESANLKGEYIEIFSDSQYCVNSLNIWYKKWIRTGFKNGTVKNLNLIKPLIEIRKKIRADLKWVKGHNGNIYNELADQLANPE
jgi:ribonuclease HI